MADMKINTAKIINRVQNASDKAIFVTSQQALKDSNYYCKQDQSGLISSSLIHSDPDHGKLVWKTPYARRQYYLTATRTIVNRRARKMWAHVAAAEHKKDWLAVYRATLKKEMKK